MRIKPNETLQERLGYLYQVEGIMKYNQGDLEEAEANLLRALQNNYFIYEGIEYLTTIYRKRRDYLSEITTLERGIKVITKEKDPNQDIIINELKKQLDKAIKNNQKSN